MYAHVLEKHVGEQPGADGKVANKERALRCLRAGCYKYPKTTKMPLADFMKHIKTHVLKAEQESRQQQQQQQQQQDQQASSSTDTTSGSQLPGQQTPNQLKHQRQRSSVTNGDLMAAGGQTPNGPGSVAGSIGGSATPGGTSGGGGGGGSGTGSGGGGSSSKRQKRSYIVPAKTISVAFEETATMRDERNPNLPPQAAGIPLSAVLVLRNIARNAAKVDVVLDERGQPVQSVAAAAAASRSATNSNNAANGRRSKASLPGTPSASTLLPPPQSTAAGRHSPSDAAAAAAAQAQGGWNERLFRPMLPRLYEIMAENRALASYITSLFQLIGEEP